MSMLGCGMVVVGLFASQIATAGLRFHGIGIEHIALYMAVCVLIMLLTAVFVWLHVYYFPIILDESGVTAHRGPRKDTLKWDEIVGVRGIKQAGIASYRILSRDGKVSIVVPKCINGLSEFEEELKARSISLEDYREPSRAFARRPQVKTARSGGYIEISTEKENS